MSNNNIDTALYAEPKEVVIYSRNEIERAEPLGAGDSIRLAYLIHQGLTDAEIAHALNVAEVRVIAAIEKRRLWSQRPVEGNQDAIREHQANNREQWRAKVAAESAAASVDAFDLVKDSLRDGSARDFKDAATGLKTMVELARQAEGMDTEANGSAKLTLNLFVARVGDNVREAELLPAHAPARDEDMAFE